MILDKYLNCILLNSERIKNIFSEKKEIKNIELINKLCFEVFEKSINEKFFFREKIKEISSFVKFDLENVDKLKLFFIKYKDIKLVDKVKNTIIIYNLELFLEITKKYWEIDSLFIKKLKLIDFFIRDLPEDEEWKFKLKLFLIEKNDVEIDYVLELLKLKQNIYNEAFIRNKSKASNLKMEINSKKSKYIKNFEKSEKKDEDIEFLLDEL